MIETNKILFRILYSHLWEMTERLRLIPEDQWDWSFSPAAPTPRILATHTWQWLICDRQHIEEPDAAKHPFIPDPPDDLLALCDALNAETELWEKLLSRLTVDEMNEPRSQFNEYPMPVSAFVGHVVQNCIYKHGQLATIFFALGLDGNDPYDAPFPNPIYAKLHEAQDCDSP